MNRFRLALLALLVSVLTIVLAGCETGGLLSAEDKRLFVGPVLEDCVGVGPQKCLLVKERMEDDWQLFYDGIEGFIWEPGYVYELDVSVRHVPNPPADGSSLSYHLVRLITKTEVAPGPL